jgi:hypothetical protein
VPTYGISTVQWNIQYFVCIANFKQDGLEGEYKANQKVDTELGKEWKYDGLLLSEVGDTTEGQLKISNQSSKPTNLAIGLAGDITLVKKNVFTGGSAQFVEKPKYYLALFSKISQGEVIPGDFVASPIEILFEAGQTKKQCVAKLEKGNLVFEEVGTNNRVTNPYDQI